MNDILYKKLRAEKNEKDGEESYYFLAMILID